MDTNALANDFSNDDYGRLTDEQLHFAIAFAEKRVCWAKEEHEALLALYGDEIATMRQHLLDRALARLIPLTSVISPEQQRRLRCSFERWNVADDEIAEIVRLVTKGRTDLPEVLTEREATTLLQLLERGT
jgi:hypothetical protein